MATNKNNKTFAAKAATLLTQKGTFKSSNALTFELITTNVRQYPRRWQTSSVRGSYRLVDGMPRIKENLDAIGVEYTTGNNAPRGGVNGDYIELTPRGRRQTAKFRAAVRAAIKAINRRYEEDGCVFIGYDGARHIRAHTFRTQVVSRTEVWQMAIVAVCHGKDGETADII